MFKLIFCTVSLLCLCACGGSDTPDTKIETSIEDQLEKTLNDIETDVDFTFIVEANNGAQFKYERGSSTSQTSYPSASTSKLVTATAILQLVYDGKLDLTDNPQDHISFWPSTGNLSNIQLKHLLSFTSGLNNEALCINFANVNFVNCVENILNANSDISEPGTEYYYNSSHLQVAGLMAIEALNVSNWTGVFDYFKAQTDLFDNGIYDLPSENNPRLAGGMHWHADDYLEFLSALYRGQILSPSLREQMSADQSVTADIIYSPVLEGPIALDWHYGFGQWVECPHTPFNCESTSRISSAGAYGSYPFIDYEHKYYGILAREGALATGHEGYAIWLEVSDLLEEWASDNQ